MAKNKNAIMDLSIYEDNFDIPMDIDQNISGKKEIKSETPDDSSKSSANKNNKTISYKDILKGYDLKELKRIRTTMNVYDKNVQLLKLLSDIMHPIKSTDLLNIILLDFFLNHKEFILKDYEKFVKSKKNDLF